MTAKRLFIAALICVLLLAALCQSAAAQADAGHTAGDEDELIAALLKSAAEQPASVKTLLRNNRPLVTPALWDKLMKRANMAYYYDSPATAFVIYDVTKDVAVLLNDKKLLALTYYNIARSHSGLLQIDAAISAHLLCRQNFEEAGLQRDIIYVLADLGALHLYAENQPRARLYSEQSIALAEQLKTSAAPPGAWPDEYGLATAHSTLGNVNFNEGHFEQGIAFLEKALALYQGLDQKGAPYSANIADTLANLGRFHSMMGDHQRALLHLNRALEIARLMPTRDRLAGILNNLGNLYMEQGNYPRAIQFFAQSLEIHRQLNAQQEVARAHVNIGLAHLKEGNHAAALEALEAGLKTAEAKKINSLVLVATEGLGTVYKERGEYDKALQWLERSWSLARQTKDQLREAESAWLRAEVLLRQGNINAAVAAASDASNIADQIGSPGVSYLAATTLGKAHLQRKNYRAAVHFLSRAIQTIEAMRYHVAGREHERALFFENKLAPYHLMIEALIEQGKPEEALAYVEQAKGRVLVEVLKSGRKALADAMTPGERAEEQRLNRTLLELNRKIMQEEMKKPADTALLRSLEAELNAARLTYEHFQNLVSAARPKSYARGDARPAFSLAEAAALLPDDKTAMLEYVVLPQAVYLFVVTKSETGGQPDLRVHRIAVGEKNLSADVAQFSKFLAARSPAFVEPARRLYDLLVAPAEAQLKGKETICIIPDGALWELPFQAVRSGTDAYLLESYALYYAPSISVLREISQRRSERPPAAGDALIAFGNPRAPGKVALNVKTSVRSQEFQALPDAEIEVAALGRIFGRRNSRVLVGQDATEAAFKQQAPQSTVIHLATHGVLNNQQPLYSYLMLAKAAGDEENDGLLEAREIMHMDLRGAELAVLSACDTARGRVGAGEGIIGMSWAFFVAGCRTVVVSQWKVDSGSTARLMIKYYENLKAKSPRAPATKAGALRMAALELIKDERSAHPFYWAGFVMMGGNE